MAEVHEQEAIVERAAQKSEHERVVCEHRAIDLRAARLHERGFRAPQREQIAVQRHDLSMPRSLGVVQLAAVEGLRIAWIREQRSHRRRLQTLELRRIGIRRQDDG